MRKRLTAALLTFLLLPQFTFALTTEDTGVIDTGKEIYGSEQADISIGMYLGERLIIPFFSILGTVFLILVIYAGIMWMTAGGNQERVGKAKRLLIHAVIGLFIIVLAYGLTRFVFEAITDAV